MKKLFIIFAVLCLAAPAMAADFNFYGSARMWTGMKDVDKEATDSGFDDTDLEWQDLGNSRFGGRVDVTDQLRGGFELGFDGSGISTRKIYGIYDFGGARLLVGRDFTPINVGISGRGSNADDALNNFGTAYDGRHNQIKLMIGGQLNIAFSQPKNVGEGVDTDSDGTAIAPDDTDTTLPKIAVGYKFKTDMMEINPFVGYQTWDMVFQTDTTETEESVDSFIGGITAAFNFGPAYFNVSGYYGQNPGAFGLAQEAFGNAIWNGTTLEDNTSLGAAVIVGFNISEMFTIEAGYGFATGETDLTAGGSKEQTAACYYVNFPITLTPGFFIVPEFAYEDYGDTDINGAETDNGGTTYYGIRWQIDF